MSDIESISGWPGCMSTARGEARLLQRLNGVALEADALVALQDRLVFASIAPGDSAVTLADRRRDVGNLEAPGLARMRCASDRVKRLQEECPHEERLEAAGFGLLHLLLDGEESVGAHRLLGERVAIQERLEVIVVECLVDLLGEARTDFRLVAVADRLHQQILETHLLKDLAQNVEDAALKRLALDFHLLQQAVVDIAFAGLLGDEIPEMAHLRLPDPVNATEALLQPIRIPGQVVVHHQVGVLEVDAFAGGIRGHEDSHVGVRTEQRLEAAAFVAVRAAMNRDDGVGVAEHARDPLMQVVQRVAVFGEDDELALTPGGVVHLRIVLEDFREFIPLAVLAGGDDGLGLLLKPLENDDLRLQFGDGLGGSRLVDQRLLEVLLLLGGQFVIVVGYGAESLGERSPAAVPQASRRAGGSRAALCVA